jgi:SAM-dependent methyltransferase
VRSSELIEITDLLIDVDSEGLRRPVRREAAIQEALAHDDRWAARLLADLPERDGYLDDDHVDRLVVAIHCEIQRLSEEFRHGARMWTHLEPILEALRRSDAPTPFRVVDVGCGTGYVVRWLAANAVPSDVELVGVDLNPALVVAANELAERERVDCRFVAADAFSLSEPATVLISTGVLHHFSVEDLGRFFDAHEASDAAAFVHVDFQRSLIAPFGAWLFHRTRMRLAISRHDGIRSAQRARPLSVLATAATDHGPRFQSWVSGRRVRYTPLPCVLNSIVGIDRRLAEVYLDQNPRSGRLEPLR